MAITNIGLTQHETCVIERDIIRDALKLQRARVQANRDRLARANHDKPSEATRARIVACDTTLDNIDSLIPQYHG